jgi:hypothetical protein
VVVIERSPVSASSTTIIFPRHRLGHAQDEPIPANRRCDGQSNAGVATGRLDKRQPGPQHSLAFSVLDERHAESILHASTRVAHFKLGDEPAEQTPSQASKFNHRRLAHRCCEITTDHGLWTFPL